MWFPAHVQIDSNNNNINIIGRFSREKNNNVNAIKINDYNPRWAHKNCYSLRYLMICTHVSTFD